MQVNDDYRALDGENEFTGENMKIEWEEGFEIRVSIDSNAVYLSANKEGLLSLVNHLTALANESPGSYIHYDEHNSLEEGSVEMVIGYNI